MLVETQDAFGSHRVSSDIDTRLNLFHVWVAMLPNLATHWKKGAQRSFPFLILHLKIFLDFLVHTVLQHSTKNEEAL